VTGCAILRRINSGWNGRRRAGQSEAVFAAQKPTNKIDAKSGSGQTTPEPCEAIIVDVHAAGEARMTDYRVYIIGSDGHFQKAVLLDCSNDEAAIESAKQCINGHDVELWQRDRLIARFAADAKDTTGWLKGELSRPC
jgi:hypothetical protein